MEGEGEGEAGEACADDGDARCWGGHCLRPRTSEMEGVDGCLYDKYLFWCIMMKTAVVAVVAVVNHMPRQGFNVISQRIMVSPIQAILRTSDIQSNVQTANHACGESAASAS